MNAYYSILYYYGHYRICQTRVYETDLVANGENQARKKFKELKPDATIKQLKCWGTIKELKSIQAG